MPAETQQLIEQALTMVRNDPAPHLSPATRFEIYKSFGPSRLGQFWQDSPHREEAFVQYFGRKFANWTIADFSLGWLAVLTARKVAHFWDEAGENSDIVKEILQTAESVLLGKADLEVANRKLCNDFNWPLELSTNLNAGCAYRAAYFSLCTILDDTIDYFEQSYPDYIGDEHIDDVVGLAGGFATLAVKAYSAVYIDPKIEISASNQLLVFVEFDPQKRLEFWEWWLTKAIPQAWELAETSLT